jgi:hypothetical protein
MFVIFTHRIFPGSRGIRSLAGWWTKVREFQLFELAAMRWILRHQDKFDVIEVCELPYLVKRLKVQVEE